MHESSASPSHQIRQVKIDGGAAGFTITRFAAVSTAATADCLINSLSVRDASECAVIVDPLIFVPCLGTFCYLCLPGRVQFLDANRVLDCLAALDFDLEHPVGIVVPGIPLRLDVVGLELHLVALMVRSCSGAI